ncbi:hypothetical protein RND71_005333 [Anisodus tanguticus]|uniref:Uncharacterized protein n=1 Tax=Anisodus tanguticus TaxID=243964 RepID=A0AAE1SRY1_9SOLA|nr:hypothetical protein RND71_005333 [Anisodus tanguticus]
MGDRPLLFFWGTIRTAAIAASKFTKWIYLLEGEDRLPRSKKIDSSDILRLQKS